MLRFLIKTLNAVKYLVWQTFPSSFSARLHVYYVYSRVCVSSITHKQEFSVKKTRPNECFQKYANVLQSQREEKTHGMNVKKHFGPDDYVENINQSDVDAERK